jgi:hypothetical protein
MHSNAADALFFSSGIALNTTSVSARVCREEILIYLSKDAPVMLLSVRKANLLPLTL